MNKQGVDYERILIVVSSNNLSLWAYVSCTYGGTMQSKKIQHYGAENTPRKYFSITILIKSIIICNVYEDIYFTDFTYFGSHVSSSEGIH
jgi:hypothetical protein